MKCGGGNHNDVKKWNTVRWKIKLNPTTQVAVQPATLLLSTCLYILTLPVRYFLKKFCLFHGGWVDANVEQVPCSHPPAHRKSQLSIPDKQTAVCSPIWLSGSGFEKQAFASHSSADAITLFFHTWLIIILNFVPLNKNHLAESGVCVIYSPSLLLSFMFCYVWTSFFCFFFFLLQPLFKGVHWWGFFKNYYYCHTPDLCAVRSSTNDRAPHPSQTGLSSVSRVKKRICGQ